MNVDDVFRAHARDELDFEDARDELHALDPVTLAQVLEVLQDPAQAEMHPLAVMVLADVGYPPAFPHLRTLLDAELGEEPELIEIPAAAAFDALAGGRFDVDRFWSGDWDEMPETFAHIRAWWDSGEPEVPALDLWLANKRAKTAASRAQQPPRQPRASAAEHAALRPSLIALVGELRALPPEVQHQIDYDAVRRVMSIYTKWSAGDDALPLALNQVSEYLQGRGSSETLARAAEVGRSATKAANEAAGWNVHHNAYMNPPAKAAACVAQALIYVASPELRNRQQGLNFARDAVEWSGGDIKAELAWQRERIRKASGAPRGAPAGLGAAAGRTSEAGQSPRWGLAIVGALIVALITWMLLRL